MPAGTIALLRQFDGDGEGICTDNTNVFICCNNGAIYKYVISGGATSILKRLMAQGPFGLATDNTNLFVGCNDGTIYKIVIATGVTTVLAKLNVNIIDMTYYNNILYAGVAGGGMYSITTA